MLHSRGVIGWIVALLILVLACHPAAAEHDRPVLRLLVFEPDAGAIPSVLPAGVDDAAVPALAATAARLLTAAFIGRPIDNGLLADIRERLAGYYVSIGRPFVAVDIPAQDIRAGVLRVNIFEMKRGRIKVEGNRWFDSGQYAGAIRTRAGDPIDINVLADDANWINHDQHRHATIAVEAGDDPLAYDLTVRAKDSLPLAVTLAADNTGSADTGLYRIGLAVDWSNALWRGDDLDYGFLTSPDQFRLLENALSYTAYLPWRDWVTISAVDVATRGHPSGPSNGFSVNGRADIISFRYAISLPGSPDLTHHIEAGYDFKTTNNNILAGGSVVFPTNSELDQFVVGYSAQRNDRLGLTGVAMALIGSPGHLTSHNTEAALGEQQAGASSSYVYGRLVLERLTNLPSGGVWSARVLGQYSSDNLLPSEQLVFGGIRSIRGFAESGATRDEGVVMQNEMRLAPVALSQIDVVTALPFVFADLGVGRNHLALDGVHRSWLEMVSAGPGLSLGFAPNAALRMDWGFPLIRNGHTGPFMGPQFGLQISF